MSGRKRRRKRSVQLSRMRLVTPRQYSSTPSMVVCATNRSRLLLLKRRRPSLSPSHQRLYTSTMLASHRKSRNSFVTPCSHTNGRTMNRCLKRSSESWCMILTRLPHTRSSKCFAKLFGRRDLIGHGAILAVLTKGIMSCSKKRWSACLNCTSALQ